VKNIWSFAQISDDFDHLVWQSSSKEDQNTFRTTLQEHWWIWPECPRHAQVNN